MKRLITILLAAFTATASAQTISTDDFVFSQKVAGKYVLRPIAPTSHGLFGLDGSGAIIMLPTGATGRALLDDADSATARTTLGLVIGTHVQAYSANLATWSGIAPSVDMQAFAAAANNAAMRAALGAQTLDADLTLFAGVTPTTIGLNIVSAADASAVLTLLGTIPGTFLGSTGSVDNAVMAADGTGGATLQARDITISDPSTSTQNNVVIANVHSGQTDSAFVLRPKGVGAFILGAAPDGTSTGGNARGGLAVDLQLFRTAASQVAGGSSSFTAGMGNTASASYTAAMGTLNVVSANYSFAMGQSNTASGTHGAVFGKSNTVSGNFGSSTGEGNTVSGTHGSAVGKGGVSTARGEVVHSMGSFATAGDAQSSEYIVRCTTTDGTAGVLLGIDAGGDQITCAEDETVTFWAHIVARRTDTDNTSAAYIVYGCADRNAAGNITLVGSVTTTLIAEDNATYNATATADTATQSVKFGVTGVAAHTVQWVGKVFVTRTKG